MLALTLERTTYVLKELHLVLPENSTNEQLEDHKKLMTTFNDNLIAKTIMIAYMKDDLVKVFEDYQTIRKVFEIVSVKYDAKIAAHIEVLVHQYNPCRMKESDNIVDRVNKMMVMAKHLTMVGNVISESIYFNNIKQPTSILGYDSHSFRNQFHKLFF